MLRLDDLDATEVACWDALADGGVLDRCTGAGDDPEQRCKGPGNDPAKAQDWPPERCVSARVLVHFLTAELPGVRRIVLRGVRIDGLIDLADVREVRRLEIHRCRLDGIALSEATVAGSLSITDSIVTGKVDLLQARIAGYLELSGTHIQGSGVALLGDRLRVDDAVYLRAGFRAASGIRLIGASIGGQLDACGAWLSGEPVALNLTSARIGGELLLRGWHPPRAKRTGFVADGEIRLSGARIDGAIECGGRLTAGTTKIALRANGVEAKSNVALLPLTRIEGDVRIVGSSIGRDLMIEAAQLDGLDVTRTKIAGVLRFAPAAPPSSLKLHDTRAARLEDRIDAWPSARDLNGLRYESIGAVAGEVDELKERRRWLKQTTPYVPQPFEQLAAVYRAEGHETRARSIALAKQGRRTKRMARWRRPGRWLLWLAVGYGYKPGRALFVVAALLAVGDRLFSGLHADGSLQPRGTGNTPEPEFAPVLYTLDLLLPIVNLKQRDAWVAVTQHAQVVSTLFIIAGWALATAVAAALSGLIKKD